MGEKFPQVSPIFAIWGPHQAGAVVAKVLSDENTRTVGEDNVAFGEAFFYGEWRGEEEDTAGAEVQEENRAVFG